MAVTESMIMKALRPPIRSAHMPQGKRQIAPLRTATAEIQENCRSDSPNSSRIGMPKTPNINHTANIKVKPVVDNSNTRLLPSSLEPLGFACIWMVTNSLKHFLTIFHHFYYFSRKV
jgi:hypothetical protein